MTKDEFGKWGEDFATNFLLQNGYSLVERNVRFKKYEVDIIAEKDNELVVVEVKVSPFSVKPCPAAVSAGNVTVVVSLAPKVLAAAPETPVTPKGLEGGVVSKPKPKSEP